jgi:hypothetical protein
MDSTTEKTKNLTLSEYIKSEELQARVSTNVDYYVNKWLSTTKHISALNYDDPKVLSALSKGIPSFNLAAFFLGTYWAIWRGIRLSWLFLLLVAFIPSSYPWILGIVTLTTTIVYGLYGNGMYLYTLVKQRNDETDSLKPSYLRLIIGIGIVLISVYYQYEF